jgi:hypothetical protein
METILLDTLIKIINKNIQEHFHKHNIYYYQDKDEFLLEVYFNLVKELTSKYKMSKKICLFTLTSGIRKGHECGSSIKDENNFCKRHSKIIEDELSNQSKKTIKKKIVDDDEETVVKKTTKKKIIDDDEEVVKKTTKKKIVDDEEETVVKKNIKKKIIDDEEEEEKKEEKTVFLIRKNKFNNFVYRDTPYIFKSAEEKFIVAKEGLSGEWIQLTEDDKKICRKKYHLRCMDIDLTTKKTIIDKTFVQNTVKLPYEETSDNQ